MPRCYLVTRIPHTDTVYTAPRRLLIARAGTPTKTTKADEKAFRRHAMFGGVFARAAAAAGGRAGLRLYGVNAFMT